MVNHPEIDCIAFTGSTETGRKIAAQAGALLKKTNLELGGIDPLIVFDDADLDIAVQGAAWARLLNAGQVCTSSKRIYIPAGIYDEFISRLQKLMDSLVIGDPMNPDTDIGPLISEEARVRVEKQLACATQEGARILKGGHRIQPQGLSGYFFAPTLLVDVKHGTLPTTEEIFGPVLSIIRVQSNEEAIQLANDSRYALGASIYTNRLDLAMKAMTEIKAGTFWINDPLTDNDAAPFGGMRLSGIGRELGEEGLDAFREPKHVHLDYLMEQKPYWFPYSKRT
jgi:betaine-aldehyde dehydrogenase